MNQTSWAGLALPFLPSLLARQSDFQKNILRLGAGTALGQLMVVAVTPILTRLYGPPEFALAGLFIAFVSCVAVAAGLRYDMAIVDARTEHESHGLLLAALLAAIPMSLLAGALYLVLVRRHILAFQQLPQWSAGLAAATVLLSGVFASCRFWYARSANFHMISRSLTLQGMGRAFVPLCLAPLPLGWVALIGAEIAGRTVGLSKMLAGVLPLLRRFVAHSTLPEFTSILKRYWRYPGIMLPSSVIDSLQSFLPLATISAIFGTVAAGQFVLVLRVSGLPAGLIAASVSDVYHSRIAEAYRNDPASISREFRHMVLYLTRISLLVYAPLTLLSPFLFGPVFGARWSGAGIINALLAPSAAVLLVSNPVSRTLNVLGFQSRKIAFDIPRAILPLSGMWLAHQFGWPFAQCIAVFASVSATLDIGFVAIVWQAIRAAELRIQYI